MMFLLSPGDSVWYWAAVTAVAFVLATLVLRRWVVGRGRARREAAGVAAFVVAGIAVGLLPSLVGPGAKGKHIVDVTDAMVLWWGAGLVCGLLGLAVLARAIVGDPSRGRRRCGKCWYDMSGTPGLKCPECGRETRSERGLHRTRRRKRWFAAAGVLLVGAGVGAVVPVADEVGWEGLVPDTVLVALMPYLNDEHVLMEELYPRVNRWEPSQNSLVINNSELASGRWRRFAAGRCLAAIDRAGAGGAIGTALRVASRLGSDGRPARRRTIQHWRSGIVEPVYICRVHSDDPHDPEAFEAVLELLKHQDTKVRLMALWNIVRTACDVPRQPPEQVFQIAADDQNVDLRRTAIECLWMFEYDDRSMAIVVQALQDSDLFVRIAGLKALARLDLEGGAFAEWSMRLLTDENEDVAYEAIAQMGRVGPFDDQTIRTVLSVLDRPNRDARAVAAVDGWVEALRWSEHPRAIHALEAALARPELRRSSMRVIRELGERARPLLPRLDELAAEEAKSDDAAGNWRETLMRSLRRWVRLNAVDHQRGASEVIAVPEAHPRCRLPQ